VLIQYNHDCTKVHNSNIYVIRMSIAKALVVYYRKYVYEHDNKEIKDILVRCDRNLLVGYHCEPKFFGGHGRFLVLLLSSKSLNLVIVFPLSMFFCTL